MQLFVWTVNNGIDDASITVYAYASDLESAKRIAISSAPATAKKYVTEILNTHTVTIHNEPVSFIKKTLPAYI